MILSDLNHFRFGLLGFRPFGFFGLGHFKICCWCLAFEFKSFEFICSVRVIFSLNHFKFGFGGFKVVGLLGCL